jgi:hypothetical protein
MGTTKHLHPLLLLDSAGWTGESLDDGQTRAACRIVACMQMVEWHAVPEGA